MVDLKKWKHKSGHFNHLMLNTCPVMPPFHSKHGEPVEDKGFQPDFSTFKEAADIHITNKSAYLLTRMDTFKVNTETKEIFVIDDFGMHIMFDCSLDDMMNLDNQILKIATYFVRKTEADFDFNTLTFPFTDRI